MVSDNNLPGYYYRLKILSLIALCLVVSNFFIAMPFSNNFNIYHISLYQTFSMFTIGSDTFTDTVLIPDFIKILIQFEGLLFVGLFTAIIILLVEKQGIISEIRKETKFHLEKLHRKYQKEKDESK
ncbi:hypothetical protein [Nitrosarchaeum koreense]|nr:hypothetical protein [Nitrosarchaeum koreense]